MKRRTFLLGAGALPLLAQTRRLRCISYNVLACGGYPKNPSTTWRLEASAQQLLSRYALELNLYHPDVLSFSESVLRPDAEKLAKDMGLRMAYFEPGVASFKGYPIGFPGTVFTRHEILESENCPYAKGRTHDPELFTRHWGRALLKTGDEEIAFFSAHLNPHKQEIRLREIDDILLVMGPHLKSGRSVLFHGDLNHRPDTPEYQRWIDVGLTDALAVKGSGPQLFTVNSVTPRGRIDYIWAAGPLAKRVKECRVLFEGAFRTNPDDSTSIALSDHLPVLADFE